LHFLDSKNTNYISSERCTLYVKMDLNFTGVTESLFKDDDDVKPKQIAYSTEQKKSTSQWLQDIPASWNGTYSTEIQIEKTYYQNLFFVQLSSLFYFSQASSK